MLATFTFLAACGSGSEAPAGGSTTVRVFGAASLTDVFTELGLAFEAENPGFDLQLNLAGSSTLRTQIIDGAPVDVFASANTAIMDEVVAAATPVGQPQVFATNELQIAVPVGNPAELSGIDDFSRSELFLGLCAEAVPCGSLAATALENAGVVASVDTREPNVRALLGKVAAGELDGGVVYATDILAADDQVEGIPLGTSPAISATYPIVVLDQADASAGGQLFVEFVLSSDGAAILAANGFGAS